MKRLDWLTYGGTITVSLLLHVGFLSDMQAAADRAPPRHLHAIEMSMVQLKPSPPPPPPIPEPPKPRPSLRLLRARRPSPSP